MTELIQTGEYGLLTDDQNVFRAVAPIFTYTCQLKLWLKDYIFAILLVAFCAIYVFMWIRNCCYQRKVKRVAGDLYIDVKKTL
jgi:hypothetical protein